LIVKKEGKMDALYIKKNVSVALTEALNSMNISLPEDKVDFVGKYLIKYVERKKKRDEEEKSLQEVLDMELNEFKEQEATQVRLMSHDVMTIIEMIMIISY
jgi:hypothetical protein